MGDLIDRGPDSRKILSLVDEEWFIELPDLNDQAVAQTALDQAIATLTGLTDTLSQGDGNAAQVLEQMTAAKESDDTDDAEESEESDDD